MHETAIKKLEDAIKAYDGSPKGLRAVFDAVLFAFKEQDERTDKAAKTANAARTEGVIRY